MDTAGRLQIDERLMGELAAAKKAIQPTDTLLVVDAMTGQEAATLVRAFNEAAPITGACGLQPSPRRCATMQVTAGGVFTVAVGCTDAGCLPAAGAILTKMDGDSRGGAALSVKEVSGRPIKFVGAGEKLEALEPFYPDRIASRILGMGALLALKYDTSFLL